MGWLSDKWDSVKEWVNPIEATKDIYKEAAKLPGTWESIADNVVDMARGDISANPFGSEKSGWDDAAGGDWLSDQEWGRTIGRAVGSWFAGGAGGVAGSGAVKAGQAYNASEQAKESANAAGALQVMLNARLNASGGGGGASGNAIDDVDEAEKARLLAAALRKGQSLEMGQMFDPNYRPRGE